jgi:hypothetical protein
MLRRPDEGVDFGDERAISASDHRWRVVGAGHSLLDAGLSRGRDARAKKEMESTAYEIAGPSTSGRST